jgi:hypothetical protein
MSVQSYCTPRHSGDTSWHGESLSAPPERLNLPRGSHTVKLHQAHYYCRGGGSPCHFGNFFVICVKWAPTTKYYGMLRLQREIIVTGSYAPLQHLPKDIEETLSQIGRHAYRETIQNPLGHCTAKLRDVIKWR